MSFVRFTGALIVAFLVAAAMFSGTADAQMVDGACNGSRRLVLVTAEAGRLAGPASAAFSGDGSASATLIEQEESALIVTSLVGVPGPNFPFFVSEGAKSVAVSSLGSVLLVAGTPPGPAGTSEWITLHDRVNGGYGEFNSAVPIFVENLTFAALSSDGSTAVFTEFVSVNQRVMYAIDVATGLQREVPNVPVETLNLGSAQLSNDGNWLLAAQVVGGVTEAVVIDTQTGAVVTMGAARSVQAAMSKNGRLVVYPAVGDEQQLQIVDRDSDANGIFDEPGGIEQLAANLPPLEAADERGTVEALAFSANATSISVVVRAFEPVDPLAELDGLTRPVTYLAEIDVATGLVGSVVVNRGRVINYLEYEHLETGEMRFRDTRTGLFERLLVSPTGDTLVMVGNLNVLGYAGSFQVDADVPFERFAIVVVEADLYRWETCSNTDQLAGIDLVGNYTLIAGADYDSSDLPGQQYCASDVSNEAPFDIVCWAEEANRQAFIDDLLTTGARPPGEAIWLGDTDAEAGLFPAPVKP